MSWIPSSETSQHTVKVHFAVWPRHASELADVLRCMNDRYHPSLMMSAEDAVRSPTYVACQVCWGQLPTNCSCHTQRGRGSTTPHPHSFSCHSSRGCFLSTFGHNPRELVWKTQEDDQTWTSGTALLVVVTLSKDVFLLGSSWKKLESSS